VKGRTTRNRLQGRPLRGAAVIRPVRADEIRAVLELWQAEAIAGATDDERPIRKLRRFQLESLEPVEGAGAWLPFFECLWRRPRGRSLLCATAGACAAFPVLRGVSPHLLATARLPRPDNAARDEG
jgi:hypothetical protein